MARVRTALYQMDTVVGDIAGNTERVLDGLERAEAERADLVAFPELAVTGYPPEDLLLKPAFVADNLEAISRIAKATSDTAALVGFVDVVGPEDLAAAVAAADGAGALSREAAVRGAPRRLRNALAVCAGGRVVGVYHKRLLPNYGVFDEERWFGPGEGEPGLYEIAGVTVGVSICEDMWFASGPIPREAEGGASLVVNVNASPYSVGRFAERLQVVRQRVAEAGCAIAYVNQVGGQDELVFDGGSMVVDARGELVAAAAQFEEQMLVVDVDVPAGAESVTSRSGRGPLEVALVSGEPLDAARRARGKVPAALSVEQEVYAALVLGTRDYLAKNGFTDAVVGLSGGIDSSLVAVVAADALGADHVHALSMPSRYSSEGSSTDAALLARNLGIDLSTVAIEEAHSTLSGLLSPVLRSPPEGLWDENLQSRIRGLLLMAVSNANGWIVLTTGNKSELATGYSTLYGDSAGGFAVIKDVPKTLVYRLCRHRNSVAGFDLVPDSVLAKAPSAELRPDQRDDESLPPYDVLDPVLDALVSQDRSIADVVASGFDAEVVTRVARLVDAAEYKRRQSPPGVRISAKAFGKDRRMPITNRYRDREVSSG
ncbi:MAG TPA: NAD+ synthase [Acidimicrobiales bacterium]|nr:NAD+ synthase [Acidimicrobiales bacterium]